MYIFLTEKNCKTADLGYIMIDETINQIINECSKLAQKEYKIRDDWVDEIIDWELCKKLKFNHTNNPESFVQTRLEF